MNREVVIDKENKRLIVSAPYGVRRYFDNKGVNLEWDKKDKCLYYPLKNIYLTNEAFIDACNKLKIEISEELSNSLIKIDYSKINKSKDEEINDLKELITSDLKLYPFQEEGIKQLVKQKHTLLADSPGLGKTIQALVYLNHLPSEKFPALIICPGSLVYNWRDQALKWIKNISKEEINILTAKEREVEKKSKVYIISYDMLPKYIKKEVKKDRTKKRNGNLNRKIKTPNIYLDTIPFKVVLIDEAHYMQNIRAKRTKAIYNKNIKDADHKILITGTPIMNRPINIYSLLKFIAPKLFNNKDTYGKRYCGARFNGFGTVYDGASNLQELHTKLSPFMIRRKKEDVLKELPDKVRSLILLDASDKEEFNKIVQTTKQEIKTIYKENGEKITVKSRELMFQQIEDMRQKIFKFKKYHCYDFIMNKLEEVDKLIIFAYHREVVSHLSEYLTSQDIKNVTLTGGLSVEEKRAVQQQFQNDKDTRVFIGSIRAANMGIDLYASSTVVFLELDWVPTNLEQAEDRAHRIGQKNNVDIFYLLLNDSVEVKMLKIVEKKLKIIEQVIEGKDEAEATEKIDNMYDELIMEIIKEK